jgi:hypothetical protein
MMGEEDLPMPPDPPLSGESMMIGSGKCDVYYSLQQYFQFYLHKPIKVKSSPFGITTVFLHAILVAVLMEV